jgi:uncharacterized membrane protein
MVLLGMLVCVVRRLILAVLYVLLGAGVATKTKRAGKSPMLVENKKVTKR